MFVHAPIESVGGYRIFGRGLIVALATLAVITGLEVSDLRARSGIDARAETVNRALKGDRLSSAPASHPAAVAPRETVSDAKLPFGCEPLVSPLVSRRLARIAGRCVF